MEKTFKTEKVVLGKRISGIVLPQTRVDFLVGRLLTIIDAMGLDERQEKSAKDLIKSEVYLVTREGWIVPELQEVLHEFMWWGRNVESSSMPHDVLAGEYTLTFKQVE